VANVVKPKLQNAGGNVKVKNYGYNEKNTIIKHSNNQLSNDSTVKNSAKIYDSSEPSVVNPQLHDVLSQQEGKLESNLKKYHIFEDVDEPTPKPQPQPGDPDFVGPMPQPQTEEKPKEEPKPQTEEKPKEEPKPQTEEKPKEEPKPQTEEKPKEEPKPQTEEKPKEEPKQEEKPKEEKKKPDSSKPYGELDMTDYPKNVFDKYGNYDQEAAKARSVLVAKYLVNEGGYTKEQAAAMAGVFWDENQCNPGEVMKEEYNKNRNSYGAGIGSWTDQSYKNQCLKDAGFPPNTPIESLTMEQQCYMLVAMSNGSQKRYYDALKRCDTIEDASATAVCITGGIGFSSHWSTHPTQAEAQRLAEAYGERNDRLYPPSSYHHNLDKRRLQRAKEVLAEL
jgi:hypothetical protein